MDDAELFYNQISQFTGYTDKATIQALFIKTKGCLDYACNIIFDQIAKNEKEEKKKPKFDELMQSSLVSTQSNDATGTQSARSVPVSPTKVKFPCKNLIIKSISPANESMYKIKLPKQIVQYYNINYDLEKALEKLTKWKIIGMQDIEEDKQDLNAGKISNYNTCITCSGKLLIEDSKEPLQIVKLSKCQHHYYHKKCIITRVREFNMPENKLCYKCRVCQSIYGILTGKQPDGTMTFKTKTAQELHVDGYENEGAIVITYKFPKGVYEKVCYEGTQRIAYLPDTNEGREILDLLLLCFERKLTFKLGTSQTTGIPNSIVWNGIPHKTNIKGGEKKFGYPDPQYLGVVRKELEAVGISTKNINI